MLSVVLRFRCLHITRANYETGLAVNLDIWTRTAKGIDPVALSKLSIIPNDRGFEKGDWVYAFGGPSPNIEIRRKTCLIIGLGNIGAEIARRLRAFDVKMYAATRSGDSQHAALVDRLVRIDTCVLLWSPQISLFSPCLSLLNQRLVDSTFISWMKPTSIIVNISRGPIVNERARLML